MKEEIRNESLSRYKKAEKIFDSIHTSLLNGKNDNFFSKLCGVLKDHGDPPIARISGEMLSQFTE